MAKQVAFGLKPSVWCLVMCGLMPLPAIADDAAVEVDLQEVRVQGQRVPKKLGEDKVHRQKLDENLVQDVHDMVRYDPGVSVVEGGRAGSNGFTIRGVDKDRVAITVDGLAQAESRSSEAFQELFGAYGNFNANRNAAELENIAEVAIAKGADSLSVGSGALGGAVMYQTKSPRHFVSEDKPWHVGLKTGYISKSHQWINSATLAGRVGGLDALFIYTHRKGHETRNHSDDKQQGYLYGKGERNTFAGKSRAIPDPQDNKSKSTLIKAGYHFNADNYLSAVYEDYRQDKNTDELSNLFSFYGDDEVRRRKDVSYRDRIGLEYENMLSSGPWDKLTINADKQDIRMSTMTWDIPEDVTKLGYNVQGMYRYRGLYQNLKQFKLAAEKHVDLGKNVTWDMAYGAGVNKGKNTNKNDEYWVYLYDPSRLGSARDQREFLISSKRQDRHVYWDNTVRLGKYARLGLGARYDKITMNTLDSASLKPAIMEQLRAVGLWDRKAEFKEPSYKASLDVNVLPSVTLQAKYSTGFRAPTTDEMWLYFPSSIVWIQPNPNLKAEKSKNIELGVDVHGGWGNVKLSGFKTKYRNFIDFVPIRHPQAQLSYAYQNINLSNAEVKGLELQGMWRLNSMGLPNGSYASLTGSYTKGKASGTQAGTKKVPINALQPFNAILGLGYQQPDGRWSLASNISYFARKKPQDTSRSYEYREEEFPYARHGRNVWLVDLLGHYMPTKNVTLRAGVFNIFNQKYLSWDSLRSIREFGAVNRVDNCNNRNTGVAQHASCPHLGINRFTAPGRHFSVMLEAKF